MTLKRLKRHKHHEKAFHIGVPTPTSTRCPPACVKHPVLESMPGKDVLQPQKVVGISLFRQFLYIQSFFLRPLPLELSVEVCLELFAATQHPRQPNQISTVAGKRTKPSSTNLLQAAHPNSERHLSLPRQRGERCNICLLISLSLYRYGVLQIPKSLQRCSQDTEHTHTATSFASMSQIKQPC